VSLNLSIPELRRRVLLASDELADARGKYLVACGWKYTSETPDSRWMWVREIDGVHWGVTVERALLIQQSIDES